MRVVVIGMGGVGSAAARFLARDGHEVIGLERFQIDHDQGSSYGGSRIFRLAYEDALFTRLMTYAFPLWEELEQDAGEELLLRCAGLFWGQANDAPIQNAERAFHEIGAEYEAWDAPDRELARRYPMFKFEQGERVLFSRDSGLVRASAVVRANARLASELGVDIREQTWVESLESGTDGVHLRLNTGDTLVTDQVLVSAGPWLSQVLGDLAPPVKVSRQTYVHLALKRGSPRMSPDRCPVWIDMDTNFYGFPEHTDHPGAKIAWHNVVDFVEPDEVDRDLHAEEVKPVLAYAARRLPGLSDRVTMGKTCLYTNTEDRDFIVDRLPSDPRVVVVGGLSGHGFKFTVALGKIAADLIAERDPGFDLTRFALSRFPAE